VEGGRGAAPSIGQRHLQRPPIAWNRGTLGQPALLGPVHQARERGLLDTEALRQFGHPLRTAEQNAEQPGLDRRQVVSFGDARVESLHNGRELQQPADGIHLIGVHLGAMQHEPTDPRSARRNSAGRAGVPRLGRGVLLTHIHHGTWHL
jgi:hypothetical protein